MLTSVDCRWAGSGPVDDWLLPLGGDLLGSDLSVTNGSLIVQHEQQSQIVGSTLRPSRGQLCWRISRSVLRDVSKRSLVVSLVLILERANISLPAKALPHLKFS